MRLLHRNLNRGDGFSLTKDLNGNDIPRYAILSHTWGVDTEEVTFKNMIDGTGKDKPGYKKIRFCAKQAARHGLHYFWVDSCCIDKSSSAELQEAINSMFRWYQNAAKCYVYLTDVSKYDQNGNTGSARSLNKPFRESKWFTRGWTLQELIAPQSVEFFSSNGTRLGDKKSLEGQIHEVTGIPVSALQGVPLSEFSVKERFLWAENRNTTRDEDKAYSLFGIFNIFLPIIYGEGQEHAFRRLEEEAKGKDKSYSSDKAFKSSSENQSNLKVPLANPREFSSQADFGKRRQTDLRYSAM